MHNNNEENNSVNKDEKKTNSKAIKNLIENKI